MANNSFDFVSFLLRWLFALVLVFGTFNPTEYSYIKWAFTDMDAFGPLTALVGVALLIGWVVFLHATFVSLGWLGIGLFTALFGCLIWLLIDIGWLDLENTGAMTWVILLLLSLVLGTGVSWSHIRRRLTGQVDVDEVDD